MFTVYSHNFSSNVYKKYIIRVCVYCVTLE